MKTKQIATLLLNGVMYRVIHDEGARINEYRVVADYYKAGENGLKHHHKQIERYADLASAIMLLAQIARGNFEIEDTLEYIG